MYSNELMDLICVINYSNIQLFIPYKINIGQISLTGDHETFNIKEKKEILIKYFIFMFDIFRRAIILRIAPSGKDIVYAL